LGIRSLTCASLYSTVNHIFGYPESEPPAPNPQAVSEPPETESNEVPASLEAEMIRNNEPPPSTNYSTPDPDFATILDYHAPPPHSMDVGDVFL
jgi:E3 ubiquitin-protein ligase CHFR